MTKVEIRKGKAFCGICNKDVSAEQRPGPVPTALKPYVLIGTCGRVIAERFKDEEWEAAS